MRISLIFLILQTVCYLSWAQSSGKLTLDYLKIDSLADNWPKESPGGIIAVIGNGKIMYQRTFGLANLPHKVKVSSETIFNVGSMAKQFTGLAFSILENRNLISLDDGIRKYFPELPDCFNPVKIRHLLTHTSGLRDAYNMMALSGRIPNQNILYREDVLTVLKRQQKLEFTSGAKFQYNSTAYVLLALTLEKVTSTPFPIWMQENIFKPIGMLNTTIESEIEEVIDNAADSYEKKGDKYLTSFGNRAFYGAGDIYTSIADIAKWGNLFALGNDMMITEKSKVETSYTLISGEKTSYGFGLYIDTHRGGD